MTCLIFRSCTALEALWLTGVDWPKARAQIGAAIRGELFLTFHLRIQLQIYYSELVVFVFLVVWDAQGTGCRLIFFSLRAYVCVLLTALSFHSILQNATKAWSCEIPAPTVFGGLTAMAR